MVCLYIYAREIIILLKLFSMYSNSKSNYVNGLDDKFVSLLLLGFFGVQFVFPYDFWDKNEYFSLQITYYIILMDFNF